MNDKVQQVLTKAFFMVEKYIEYIEGHREINPKQDISVFEAFLYNILEKLIDQKQQGNA